MTTSQNRSSKMDAIRRQSLAAIENKMAISIDKFQRFRRQSVATFDSVSVEFLEKRWPFNQKSCKLAMVAFFFITIVTAIVGLLNGFQVPEKEAMIQSRSQALGGFDEPVGKGRKTSGIHIYHAHSSRAQFEEPKVDPQKIPIGQPGYYLYHHLKEMYNTDILPVNDTRASVKVRLLLKLTQIVGVDERNQVMTTNVWLRHEWNDNNLKWNPADYGNIVSINIPASDIWLPDTVLYNNADGDYQITINTKVQVRYDGLVIWEPPAIYKSFCAIDVEFFPYDTQLCEMKFGPWTEDVSKVDYYMTNPANPTGKLMDHLELAADVSGFYESVEWDLLKITGNRRIFKYPCCEEEYVDITYVFHVRRKTLFYTINLIIPCVAISFLTVLVFYLPCESGEKVALSISILVSLTVFILLLNEIMPPTSLALPLMGKYLLFTMILVTLSIAVTVIVLYNHFRHPYAYSMPHWVRYVFLNILPRILMFHTPRIDSIMAEDLKKSSQLNPNMIESINSKDYASTSAFGHSFDSCSSAPSSSTNSDSRHPHCTCPTPPTKKHTGAHQKRTFFRETKNTISGFMTCPDENRVWLTDGTIPAFSQYFNLPEVRDAMHCIQYISNRYKEHTSDAEMKAQWEAVSRVLDRFFLIIFSMACFFGSVAILLHAPSLYDTTPAILANINEEITNK